MFRMYSGTHDEEYRLMDSLVEEQYLIGGVTGWLYAYMGPKANIGSTDATKPKNHADDVVPLSNYIWMENSQREYSVDAISLPLVYQTQDASMDLQIPGLFLFETMDVTLPYNLMIERLGRKIMKGDVIELANLRDVDPLYDQNEAMNRFYVVHDAFKSGDGYSHTWFHHVWKLRLVPMTDSPEFKDILGTGENEDDLRNSLSTYQNELNIMDLITGQADKEVPYMHWDNEHIHEAIPLPERASVAKGFKYPDNPQPGNYFIIHKMPDLYDWGTDSWSKVTTTSGMQVPTTATDGQFFWHLHYDHERDYVLLQFDKDITRWQEVSIEEGESIPTKSTGSGYFVHLIPDSPIMVYDGTNWVNAEDEKPVKYTDNKKNSMDSREVMPNMEQVAKGTQFPQNAQNNTYFLRTDSTPNVLWKFENNKWRKFNHGGRMPWTGADQSKTRYLNNRKNYTNEANVATPSRVNSADVVKPQVND